MSSKTSKADQMTQNRRQQTSKSVLPLLTLVFIASTTAVSFSTLAHAGLYDWFDGGPGQQAQPQVRKQHQPNRAPARGGGIQPQQPPPSGSWNPFTSGIFDSPPAPPPEQPAADPGLAGPLDPNAQARAEFNHQPPLQLPIYVTKIEWTDADEANWAKFITQLGRARAAKKCTTIKSCLQSPEANMYADQDPPSLILYSDCAEFPYLLRVYFAYHNGLPFSHVTEVKMNMVPYASAQDQDAILATKQLDNDPYGNVIVARGGPNLAGRVGYEPNLIPYIERTFNGISTRSFRVGALTPGFELSDVYPVTLDRNGIGPGTVVHTTGHAMIVWNVDAQGVIHVIDGHPDGSMQYKIIEGSTLERSRPDQGLGFYRFRPLHIAGAQQSEDGTFYGGKVVTDNDQKLFAEGKYSLDQWFGPGSNVAPGSKVGPDLWKTAFSKVGGFFQYLAVQMRDKSAVIQADDEVGSMMQSLCDQMQQRVDDISGAIKQNLTSVPHPESIPADVFGEADALVWGPYATNGRDGRLKASVRDIVTTAIDQYRVAKRGDSQVHFAGSAEDFVASLTGKLKALNKSCLVRYSNSRGSTITLSYGQMLSRLNRLSFDPYLCAEKRWGASGSELATCVDKDAGNTWYKAESSMYNTVDKNNANGVPVIRSDRPITLAMMQDKSLVDTPDSNPVSMGTATPPMMDLNKVFNSTDFLSALKSN